MYHALEDYEFSSGLKDPGERAYIVMADQFEKHLHYLYQNRYQTILLKDLTSHNPLPEKPIILTFDDGHLSDYSIAFPLLMKYGFKADFFITTSYMNDRKYLLPDQVKEMSCAGMGIGSHTVTHNFLTDLNDDSIEKELSVSKDELKCITGKNIDTLSAPGGRIDGKVQRIARQIGYSIICGSQTGLARPGHGEVLPRIALRMGTDIAEYEKITSGNTLYYQKQRLRCLALSTLKTILGNTIYANLHRRFHA